MPKKRLKMYLIAKIWKEVQDWNEEICSFLHDTIDVFMPHRYNPFHLPPHEIPLDVFDKDMSEIRSSDFGLILPPYGNDCAYEVGVYNGMGRPVIAFTRHHTKWLDDWMVKGGISCVVTDDKKTYKALKNDHVLSKKQVRYISSLSKLPDLIHEVVTSSRSTHP